MDTRPSGLSRREFVKVAVAIGGTSALSACAEIEGSSSVGEPEPANIQDTNEQFPGGRVDPSTLPKRQHAWNDYLVRDPHNNTVLPQHQLILLLNYEGGTPTADHRRRVEETFQSVERAYRWGTEGDAGAILTNGLLFMVGYSPAYFDRFEHDLPSSVDLPAASEVLETLDEDAIADDYDAAMVLASGYGSILLSTEEALFGGLDRLNGVEMTASLDGVFEKAERRTGFVGKGFPNEEFDVDAIPKDAPLSMGYKSGFADNQPPEDKVTIRSGAFSEGTTLMISRLTNDLGRWYEKDPSDRAKEMFSTEHTVEQVGETAEPLGSHSGLTRDMVEEIDTYAHRHHRLGHAQKTARARDDDFEPVILRRSEGNATDSVTSGTAALNFTSIQRTMTDFVNTREAMNSHEFDDTVDDPHHGIRDFISVERRGTYLVPPRSLRALPEPRPDA